MHFWGANNDVFRSHLHSGTLNAHSKWIHYCNVATVPVANFFKPLIGGIGRGRLIMVNNPCTGLDSPWEFQEVKAPRFQDNKHMKAVMLSALLTGHLNPPPLPRKYSWYSFLLEAESTPVPYCGRKDYFNEEFQWHHRESNPRPGRIIGLPFSVTRRRDTCNTSLSPCRQVTTTNIRGSN